MHASDPPGASRRDPPNLYRHQRARSPHRQQHLSATYGVNENRFPIHARGRRLQAEDEQGERHEQGTRERAEDKAPPAPILGDSLSGYIHRVLARIPE